MHNILVVVFDNERQAYEGYRALKELDAEGTLKLCAQTVIATDGAGNASVKESTAPGPLGTAVGLVAGGLVGLLSGPAGIVAGAALGAFGGGTLDYATMVIGTDFLEEAKRQLEPGKAAIVAEVDENWTLPLDTRMQSVGGTVIRRARGEVIKAQFEGDAAAIEAGLAALRPKRQTS